MLHCPSVSMTGEASTASSTGQDRFPWPLLAFGLAFPTLLTLVYFVALAHAPRPLQQGVYGAGKLVQFGLPAAWWLLHHRRAPRLAWPGSRGVVAGLVAGLVIFAAAVALYHGVLVPRGLLAGGPAEAIRAKVAGFGMAGPLAFLALAVFYSFIHSAAEEYYWRWFVFGGLRGATALGPALLWSSVGFTSHHVVVLASFFGLGSPLTWVFSLAIGCGGAFWAWLYHRSGSLTGPWLSHLLADAAIFAVGWDLLR